MFLGLLYNNSNNHDDDEDDKLEKICGCKNQIGPGKIYLGTYC